MFVQRPNILIIPVHAHTHSQISIICTYKHTHHTHACTLTYIPHSHTLTLLLDIYFTDLAL